MVPLPGSAPGFKPMPLLPMISVALVSVMLPSPLRFRTPVLGSWAEAPVLGALRPITTKLPPLMGKTDPAAADLASAQGNLANFRIGG